MARVPLPSQQPRVSSTNSIYWHRRREANQVGGLRLFIFLERYQRGISLFLSWFVQEFSGRLYWSSGSKFFSIGAPTPRKLLNRKKNSRWNDERKEEGRKSWLSMSFRLSTSNRRNSKRAPGHHLKRKEKLGFILNHCGWNQNKKKTQMNRLKEDTVVIIGARFWWSTFPSLSLSLAWRKCWI